jgi:dTDP-4-amino-4,6-dideoxygalactose transaminase
MQQSRSGQLVGTAFLLKQPPYGWHVFCIFVFCVFSNCSTFIPMYCIFISEFQAMKVPLLDLKLQYKSIQHEIEPVLLRMAASQSLILGQEVEHLEKSCAAYCGTNYAIGVSSGTDALLMALMALNIGPGDEVILPTFSFFATAGVVSRLNATPVFVDIDPLTFNISPDAIQSAITSNTKAIMPVHLYGQCADMDSILQIAAQHGIPVIEDCAQAIGTQMKDGRRAGSMGLMGCFSFYPTKNLGAFGDAGLITVQDKSLYERLIQMRNHGQIERYKHGFVGGNFRIDALQAAVLNVKFPYLPGWHQARRNNAALYQQLFMQEGLSTGAGNLIFDQQNAVLLPGTPNASALAPDHHIFNQYVIRVRRRNALRAWLSEQGIGTEVYYPIPFHRQPCFANNPGSINTFPFADCASTDVLALPVFPELQPDQIKMVVDAIAYFEKNLAEQHQAECGNCDCGKNRK